MITGRPKRPLVLTEEQRIQLESLSRSRAIPHGLVQRAKIILMAADGLSNTKISERLGMSKPSVGKWRQRYLDLGIQGLEEALRPGRPRTIADEKVALVVRKTLKTKPKLGTHWSVRAMAGETGVSMKSVHRI